MVAKPKEISRMTVNRTSEVAKDSNIEAAVDTEVAEAAATNKEETSKTKVVITKVVITISRDSHTITMAR